MLDLSVLDEYAKQFHGMQRNDARSIEQSIQSIRERWILTRFLDGFLTSISPFDTIVVLPTVESIDVETLELCKEGIERYFIEPTGLQLGVEIQGVDTDYAKEFENLKIQTEEGTKTFEYNLFGRFRVKPFKSTLIFVDDSEFFREASKRVTGLTDVGSDAITVLARAHKKGRIKDGKYIDMTEKEKREYMRLVAAHEIRHAMGFLEDINNVWSHQKMGYPDVPSCLGYSKFQIPSALCEGCRDSIISLWYGIQLRTGKEYITQDTS